MRLVLFIAGDSAQSKRAKGNVQVLIDEHTNHDITFKLIDLHESPDDAVTYNILAIPTLLREDSQPATQVIGDLSDCQRVWEALSI